MCTPVVHYTAADSLVRTPPKTRVPIIGLAAFDMEHLADQALIDQAADGQVIAIPAPVVEQAEHQAFGMRQVDHFVGFRHGDAKRLLLNHMFTRLQALQGGGGMQVVRQDIDHQVEIFHRQHLIQAGEISLQTG